MKKYILLSLLTASVILLHSQTLEENKTDEFTGARILRSSWETFSMPKKVYGIVVYVRASYINGTTYLDAKFSNGSVFAVDEGENFMLLLTSGDVIKLNNPEFRITSIGEGARGYVGSGAMGIELSFRVSDETIKKFKIDPPTKIRLYTTDGYLEGEVNKKEALRLAGVFQIIGK